MRSTCTETFCPVRSRRGARRALAEIELVLIIIVILLPILLLMGASWRIGGNVLSTVYAAENDAYAQVISGMTLQVSADPVPPEGINAVRPMLPNRFAIDQPSNSAVINDGTNASTFTYSDKAVFVDPTWHFSSYPPSGESGTDHQVIVEWFADYVAEDHPPALVYSLGLQPAGPP